MRGMCAKNTLAKRHIDKTIVIKRQLNILLQKAVKASSKMTQVSKSIMYCMYFCVGSGGV